LIVKKILKKIFPAPLLKAAFLQYNRLRLRTVDKILFPEFVVDKSAFKLYRSGYPFGENEISLEGMPPGQVKDLMNDWYSWTQEEFILEFTTPCWIEPDHGWAIVAPNRLLYYSLGVSRTEFQPKPQFFRFLFRRKVVQLERAISLRDTGEENYFHFYNDVVAKLHFLKLHGFDVTSVPVVISRKAWNKPYFGHLRKMSPFVHSINWQVQTDEYLACRQVIFCKPLTHHRQIWQEMISPLLPTVSAAQPRRKIFLNRSRSRLRFIENQPEVDDLCRDLGLEVVDTDNLSPSQQIELFAQVELVVGVHGAGLTNMVFARGPASVLEIFPPPDSGYLPYHYIMLASMKGFRYHAHVAYPGRPYSGGFRVNIDNLKADISRLFN
jgi:hypothetical protein